MSFSMFLRRAWVCVCVCRPAPDASKNEGTPLHTCACTALKIRENTWGRECTNNDGCFTKDTPDTRQTEVSGKPCSAEVSGAAAVMDGTIAHVARHTCRRRWLLPPLLLSRPARQRSPLPLLPLLLLHRRERRPKLRPKVETKSLLPSSRTHRQGGASTDRRSRRGASLRRL